MRNALNTPWKVTNEIKRLMLLPAARLYFAWHRVRWGIGWRMFGLPLIQRHGGSHISIGHNLQMRNWFTTNPLGINHRCVLATWSMEAFIHIGDNVGMSGTSIVTETGITIGSRVRIGANSVIADTDFHPLAAAERQAHPKAGQSRPIIIEDDVFLGMNVLVLKGSHIGQGSVIGAGSVVSGQIPPGMIAAGNHARVIRQINA
jgi:acetyltransferase-like isoleucine patch superfamily enzyme